MKMKHKSHIAVFGLLLLTVCLTSFYRFSRTEYSTSFDIGQHKPCTLGLFREFFKAYDYFPDEGHWATTNDHVEYYDSNICTFSRPRIGRAAIRRCIANGNITSIATMGDSNANKFNKALYGTMKNALDECRDVKHEYCVPRIPDKNYYNQSEEDWAQHVQVSYRHCGCCGGDQHECRAGNHKIRIEHIGNSHIIDDSIQIHVDDPIYSQFHVDTIWAPTAQEFIFRYFLKDHYPDVLLVYLPFNHAKVMHPDKAAADMKYFMMLAEHYIPQTTKIFYIPAFAEFENARRENNIWFNRKFFGRLATEQIDVLNHKLFDLLRTDLLDTHGRVYGFLDSLSISLTREKWSADGVHMQWDWYEAMISLVLDLLCNSIKLNQF